MQYVEVSILINIGMPKSRVTVNLSDEVAQDLEQWAKAQNRSTSNLAATILEAVIKANKHKIYTDISVLLGIGIQKGDIE